MIDIDTILYLLYSILSIVLLWSCSRIDHIVRSLHLLKINERIETFNLM